MLIVANWKAYVEDVEHAKALVSLSKRLARSTKHTIVLAPPAPLLGVCRGTGATTIAFSAQDISVTTGGAATGEATAQAFVGAGATYAIIGHSERRKAGDTLPVVAEKLRHALAQGLIPILCVGESARDPEGRYLNAIREQLTSALELCTQKDRANVIVAYEPIWAIGGSADSAIRPDDLAEMVLYIQKVMAELLLGNTTRHPIILYGGSVEASNVRELALVSHVSGFLVGRASTDAGRFTALLKEL